MFLADANEVHFLLSPKHLGIYFLYTCFHIFSSILHSFDLNTLQKGTVSKVNETGKRNPESSHRNCLYTHQFLQQQWLSLAAIYY